MKPFFNLLFWACNLLFIQASAQVKDTAIKPVVGAVPATTVKPYRDVITAKAKTDSGLFKVHYLDEKYFFEIPDSLLGRELLVVNRISKGAAGLRMSGDYSYAGDEINENVIAFEKGPKDKLFLRNISVLDVAKDSAGLFQSVRASNLQPIYAVFAVRAYGNASSVIELTDYIAGDNNILFFDPAIKQLLTLGPLQADRSYIEAVRAYPANVEIKTVKTYNRSTPSALPVTIGLNSSMVLLPKAPMKGRYYDERVGYFSTGYTDFDQNPQGVKRVRLVTRWRMEPKPGDEAKYLRGELVEPQKPIVFYIDPATPKKWVPYLIQGVNDWQRAFEKAGFKNAIYAKEASPADSTWTVEDAGHSVIVYKPSDITNASGPHVHDPRSGEIIETHINWYHNVMQLIRDWYFVQASPLDTGARKLQFSDDLMGQLIRFVSSHEVGHTLGLMHNYGSSSTVPVDSLRNKAWVEAHGHTPSIMDYARFNYVAQPEDGISRTGLFPRIGDYDQWAIEWGYRWFPTSTTVEEETKFLAALTSRMQGNKRLRYGSETFVFDPRNQNEDLGDDAMKASAYGIKNLKRILPNLKEWTKTPGENYDNLARMYAQVVNQYAMYTGHVARYIGGVYLTPVVSGESGLRTAKVPKQKQQAALKFLQNNLFEAPSWLIDSSLWGYTTITVPSMLGAYQNTVLNQLTSSSILSQLYNYQMVEKDAYTVEELFADLSKGIWKELNTATPINPYRRVLQKNFTERLIALSVPLAGMPSEVTSVAKARLRQLEALLKKRLPNYRNDATRYHLEDVAGRVAKALRPDK